MKILVIFSLLFFGLVSGIEVGDVSEPEPLDISKMEGNEFEEDYETEDPEDPDLTPVNHDEFLERSSVSCNSIERGVNNYRRSQGLGNLICDSALREIALYKSYDHADDNCKAFCSDSCNGHGWHSAKWSLSCPGRPCDGCRNWILNKYFPGSGLFISGEISAYHSNSGFIKKSAVKQWIGSSGHERLMVSRSATHLGCNHFKTTANCEIAQK